MKTDGRGQIVAIVACVGFYLAYTFYLQKKYPEMGKPKTVAESTTNPGTLPGVAPGAPAPAGSPVAPTADVAGVEANPGETVAKLAPEQLRFETDNAIFTFDQDQGALTSVKLKQYLSQIKDGEKAPVELLDGPSIIQLSRDFSQIHPANGLKAERKNDQTIAFSRKDGEWQLEWEYTFHKDSYAFDLVGHIKNLSANPQDLNAGFFDVQNEGVGKKASMFAPGVAHKKLTTGINGSRSSEVDLYKHCTTDTTEAAANLKDADVNFFGIDDHYFLRVLQPIDKNVEVNVTRAAMATNESCQIISKTLQRFGLVGSQGEVALTYRGYYGPKDVSVLEKHDASLKQAVNFGFFGILARPLLTCIETAFSFAKNYGLAIIIVTFFLKLCFYPLTRKAAISMKRMQKLQPEMKKIQEKFKDDPPLMQKELMKFMSANKANPFQGCLPILPQIPVFMAFYSVLSQAIELRHAPFFGWIHDLSAQDPYYITPVFLVIAMFLQQRLTPNPAMDKSQEKIMMIMPVVFGLMMLSLPAGMVLYMITNTIVSMAQQQWLNRRLEPKAA